MLTPLAFSTGSKEKRQRPGGNRIPEERRQYFLEVHLRIAAANQDAFVTQGKALLDTFKANGLTLTASAWSTNSDPISVVNYWDIGSDADALLEAELALPDVPEFNGFNKLIDHEVKAISIPIARAERVDLPQPPPNQKLSADYRYLRASMQVRSPALPEFAARIDGYMVKFTREAEWSLGNTYYSITGNAGQVSQLWVIRKADSRDVDAKLRRAPWLTEDLIGNTLTFDVLRATPSDPNLYPSRDAR